MDARNISGDKEMVFMTSRIPQERQQALVIPDKVRRRPALAQRIVALRTASPRLRGEVFF